MNDSIANTTSIGGMDIPELIQSMYINYVADLVQCVVLCLVVYTTILAMPQEIVYMWLSSKPFSIPNLLYAITRYSIVVTEALDLWITFSPPSKSLCNILYYAGVVVGTLGYIGVQGLLITRAYTLCRGNKVVTVILALFWVGGFGISTYVSIIYNQCQSSSQAFSRAITLALLVGNICTASTDLVVFGVCLWKVWDTWRLKRETGIQHRGDLVSIILRQTVSRFCFVILFTTALTIVDELNNNDAITIVGDFQQSLSAILIADFTLDLRRKNSAAIQAADIKLPTIQIRSVVRYIHRSILVEMGDHETSVDTSTEDDDDILWTQSSDAVEIGHEEPEAA